VQPAGDGQATPNKSLFAGAGMLWKVQSVPFQTSPNGSSPLLMLAPPIARQESEDVQDTLSMLAAKDPAGAGRVCKAHPEPAVCVPARTVWVPASTIGTATAAPIAARTAARGRAAFPIAATALIAPAVPRTINNATSEIGPQAGDYPKGARGDTLAGGELLVSLRGNPRGAR